MTDTLSLLRAGKLAGATRLDLSCGLTEFPHEIFDLADSLEILNLSGNRLRDLPDELPRLSKLKILFCSANDFRHLPPVIGQCPRLEMVGFKSNRIAEVPGGALSPQLRWLILTANRIPSLPPSLGRCTRLQKLMLAGNRLESLPEEMSACQSLELLRLSANRFRELPGFLLELPRLAWLAFGGNLLDGGASPTGSIPELAWQDIQIHEALGEGASGTIHRAEWQGRAIAVKIFKSEVTSDGLPADEMATRLAAGDHLHLIPVLGKVKGHPQEAQALVMDYLDGQFSSLAGPPDFATCTRDVYRSEQRFTRAAALRIAAAMAGIGAELQQRGILHGDFYAHNILINDAGDALLGDFGAASFHPPGISPPMLERLEVRAFGCLLEELAERCEGEAAELHAMARRCLSPRPGERPLFAEITRDLAEIGSC